MSLTGRKVRLSDPGSYRLIRADSLFFDGTFFDYGGIVDKTEKTTTFGLHRC